MLKFNNNNGFAGVGCNPLVAKLSTLFKNFNSKCAFTLAEVLITLGIIGVVAAMSIPSLIASYQKKVYYSKFMKARMVIENALKLYQNETGCGDIFCGGANTQDYIKEFSKHFNVATFITPDNYKKVCKNYKKVAINYDGTDKIDAIDLFCNNELPSVCNPATTTVYGFITKDGNLFSFCTDAGYTLGAIVDTNGPDNTPNTFGRDIFVFYNDASMINYFCGSKWGMSKACYAQSGLQGVIHCYGDIKEGSNCGARLKEEGKMNY